MVVLGFFLSLTSHIHWFPGYTDSNLQIFLSSAGPSLPYVWHSYFLSALPPVSSHYSPSLVPWGLRKGSFFLHKSVWPHPHFNITQGSPLCPSHSGLASCWRTQACLPSLASPWPPQPTSQNTSSHWLYQTAYSFFPMPMFSRFCVLAQDRLSTPSLECRSLPLASQKSSIELEHHHHSAMFQNASTTASGCPLHPGEVSLQESSLVWGLHCHHHHSFWA